MVTHKKVCYNTNIMEYRDRWYSAGIIDGEGYIGIMRKKHNRSDYTIPYNYIPAVKVASVDERLIDYLMSIWKGFKSKRIHTQVNHKQSWMWEIKNWSRVEEFLNIIYP